MRRTKTKSKRLKLNEQDNVYVLWLINDHQRKKLNPQSLVGLVLMFVEKASPNINYLIRKVGTEKTEVTHCMRLQSFTHREAISDVKTTSQDCLPDPRVIIKHDLYATELESENEKLFLRGTTINKTFLNHEKNQ